jgi:sporulation protein YlmC with PRC-barrel domain
MKIGNLLVTSAAGSWLLLTGAAMAQNEQPKQTTNDARSHLHRASAMKGMVVRNAKGEDLGHIRDLMISTKDGKAVYAAIGYGGTLGVNEKFAAVPLNALRFEQPKDRPQTEHVLLDVDKATFDSNTGFNKNEWPTTAEARFSKSGKPAENVGATPKDEPGQYRRASALIGMTIRNPQGESLGTVRDLVIDWKDDRIHYAVMGHGGTLGVGEKLFAIPWDASTIKSLTGKPGDEGFVVNVQKSALDANAGFTKDNWPAEGDKNLFRKAGTNPERP